MADICLDNHEMAADHVMARLTVICQIITSAIDISHPSVDQADSDDLN